VIIATRPGRMTHFISASFKGGSMLTPLRYNHLLLTVLALTTLLFVVVSSACSVLASEPTPEGRLLLISNQNGSPSIFEYKDGMDAPQPLWTGFPYAWFTPSGSYVDPEFAVSADKKFVMPYGNAGIVDLTTGTFQKLPLEGVTQLGSRGIYGAFSPDSHFLAYSLTGDAGYSRSGLYLFDLTTSESTTLYEGPCEFYDLFGEVCGGTGRPFWIDKNTLVFNGYAGTMPNSVQKFSEVEEPLPNRTFVIALDGTLLQEISPMLGSGSLIENQLVSGPTMLFGVHNGVTETEWNWLETADLVQGVINANPISGMNFVLSPDGQFVLQRIDNQWHLIELRTGTDKKLKGEYLIGCLHAAWSPDGKYLACSTRASGNFNSYRLLVISLESGTIREIKEAEGYFLVTWVH
jgi:WD40 repeat protein